MASFPTVLVVIVIKMERLREIFDQFDRDNSGHINKKELGNLSSALNDPLTPAELHDFFNKVDVDKSGKISWDEFFKYWTFDY